MRIKISSIGILAFLNVAGALAVPPEEGDVRLPTTPRTPAMQVDSPVLPAASNNGIPNQIRSGLAILPSDQQAIRQQMLERFQEQCFNMFQEAVHRHESTYTTSEMNMVPYALRQHVPPSALHEVGFSEGDSKRKISKNFVKLGFLIRDAHIVDIDSGYHQHLQASCYVLAGNILMQTWDDQFPFSGQLDLLISSAQYYGWAAHHFPADKTKQHFFTQAFNHLKAAKNLMIIYSNNQNSQDELKYLGQKIDLELKKVAERINNKET